MHLPYLPTYTVLVMILGIHTHLERHLQPNVFGPYTQSALSLIIILHNVIAVFAIKLYGY
jgi:hypothetical protein